MSLDISLYDPETKDEECFCSTCWDKHYRKVRTELFCTNITHNLITMASVCGLYHVLWRPEEVGIRLAADAVEQLESGLELLDDQGIQGIFEMHAPENEWGSLGGLKASVREYLEACRKYPHALVEVSR